MAHEDLVAEVKLEDKKLEERDFVRIEISPKDIQKATRNRDDWNFKLDENKSIPSWYEKNVVAAQKACWEGWQESIQVNLALEKEEKTVIDTLIYSYDSSTVEAYDSSTVVAHGSSTVVAHGSSTVVAYGSSTVEAYDSSTVEAYGSSTVELKSSFVAVLCHEKIFVTEKAVVVRASVVKANEV
jgi:hypothetical protein